MARKISEDAGYVHVTDPETGVVTVLEPGDTVPSKLEKLVGEHATTGSSTSRRAATVAGPSQTPETVKVGEAAQKAADDAAPEGDAKAKADADALAAAEAAEAKKNGGA